MNNNPVGITTDEAAKVYTKMGTLTLVGIAIAGYLMYSWLIKR